MMFALVTRWDADGRVNKHLEFESEVDAVVALAGVIDRWPDAFVAEAPVESAGPREWIADAQAGTLTYSPLPQPTDAERAAGLVLRRAAFLMAVDAALDLASQPGAPDPADYIIGAIQASGGALGAAERSAILLVRFAGEFHRDDPAAPGLMNAVGALLGLSPGQIDALFVGAAG